MATPAAIKRLTKEYANICKSPPPYIVAHPNEVNILEWHYILTGPPDTPYADGQYWGTLMFPPDYPFAPPAIRMHTPSGRFQPSTRLCLSISDFHPKSFNPTWEVSTILIGLMSFMTGEEMTTGSVRGSAAEREAFAWRSRWWNSTHGGSSTRRFSDAVEPVAAPNAEPRGLIAAVARSSRGTITVGDGGAKFRAEWPDLDESNWKWMRAQKIDPATGVRVVQPGPLSRSPEAAASKLRLASAGANSGVVGVVDGGQQAGDVGRTWLGRHKWMIAAVALCLYVMLARVLSTPAVSQP